MNKVIDILLDKKDLFTEENLGWIASAGYDSERFSGKYTADWWRGLIYETNGVLAEALITGNQSVISLFPAENIGQITIDLEALRGDVESERFAELGKATLMFNQKTPVSPFIDKISDLAESANH